MGELSLIQFRWKGRKAVRCSLGVSEFSITKKLVQIGANWCKKAQIGANPTGELH
jgi:hypothetical protein